MGRPARPLSACFAFENYEIAAYRSLITMTEVVGMPQFRAPLEASLREETAMAQWLGDTSRERD